MSNNRIGFVDIAKAIGILTVIASHSVIGRNIWMAYAYMIPIFFILSGYTYKFKGLTYKEECKNKFFKLIIPYIFFNIILVSFSFIITNVKNGGVFLILTYWVSFTQDI